MPAEGVDVAPERCWSQVRWPSGQGMVPVVVVAVASAAAAVVGGHFEGEKGLMWKFLKIGILVIFLANCF